MSARIRKQVAASATVPTGYGPLLAEWKERVQAAQVKAALAVNRQLIALYRDMVARPVALSVLRPGQPNRAMAILEGKLWCGPDGRVDGYGLKCFPGKNEGPPGSPSGPPPNG